MGFLQSAAPDRKRRIGIGLIAVLTAVLAPVLSPAATMMATAALAQPSIVSAVPAAFTPNVLDGAVQKMVRIGNTMFLGGTFTQVQDVTRNVTYSRTNLVAFDMTTGMVSTTFDPVVVGGEVSGMASDGTSLFVGGAFTSVNGQTTRVAKLNATTGATVSTWLPATMDGRARDLSFVGGRLWVSGDFTRVGGVPMPALATLRPGGGGRDPYALGLVVSGPFTTGIVNVRKMALNPTQTRMLIIGNFNALSGQTRQQIAMLDLTGSSVALSPWATSAYGPQNNCASRFDTWMRNIDWSPDGTWFVAVTTGAWGGGTSLCDAAARFEYNDSSTNIPTWVAQTGGDSLFSVAITGSAVYIGGHQRWVNNPLAANVAGPGAVPREGLAALDPRNGMPLPWNPTRDRGVGVFDMLVTTTGLWIAHDTNIVANLKRERIAFFPLAGGQAIPADTIGQVPNTAYLLGRTADINTNVLYRVNAAGPKLTSTDSGSGWLADNATTNPLRQSGGNVSTNTAVAPLLVAPNPYAPPVGTPTTLYQSERYNLAPSPPMVWTFPVTAGNDVTVRLYVADRWATAVGNRVFNVSVNGVPLTVTYPSNGSTSADIDLFKLLGRYNGGMITSPVATSPGTITVTFTPKVNNPTINAIELVTNGGALGAPGSADDARLVALSGSSSQLPQSAPTGGIAWSQARGALMINNQVFYGWADGSWHTRTFDGISWGPDAVINQYYDPTSQASQWATELPNVRSMFWEAGRLYYTLAGSTNLMYRSMAPTTGYLGAQRQVVQGGLPGLDWASVTGAFPGEDGYLYVARADGTLSQLTWSAGTLLSPGTASGSPTVVSGPGLDGASWAALAVFVRATTTLPVRPTVVTNPPSCTGKSCTLSGTATGRGPFTMSWNFGDGVTVADIVAGQNDGTAVDATSHTFPTSGTYPVRLTATDAAGQVVTTASSLTVTNIAPTASFTANCSGRACVFDGTVSTDDGPGGLSYAWVFGDGTTANTVTTSHIYATDGTYTALLTVTDREGLTGSTRQSLSVVNGAPTAQILSIQCQMLTCIANGLGSDPEGNPVTYSWLRGNSAGNNTGSSATWTYATPGTYTVSLTVTDNVGAQTVVSEAVKVSSSVVAFRDQAKVQINADRATLTVPASVQPGDGLIMFVSTNAVTGILTNPTGWVQRGERVDGNLRTRLLTRVAIAGIAGSVVTIAADSIQRIDVSLVAYNGTDTSNPVAAWQSVGENLTQATHTTPLITVPGLPGQPGVAGTPIDGGWVISHWIDRSGATTAWTIPTGLNQRGAVIVAPVAGRLASLTTDSNVPVRAGAGVGGLGSTASTSTGTSPSVMATMWTVVLQRR